MHSIYVWIISTAENLLFVNKLSTHLGGGLVEMEEEAEEGAGSAMHTYDFDQIRLTIALTSAVTCFMHKNTAPKMNRNYSTTLYYTFIYVHTHKMPIHRGFGTERISGWCISNQAQRGANAHTHAHIHITSVLLR